MKNPFLVKKKIKIKISDFCVYNMEKQSFSKLLCVPEVPQALLPGEFYFSYQMCGQGAGLA